MSPEKTPNPYDKENEVLRPLLKKYKNVEENVLTLKLKDVVYQLVEEERPDQIKHVSRKSFSFYLFRLD